MPLFRDADQFMHSSLVNWFRTCLRDPGALRTLRDLADGHLLYQVFLEIDPSAARLKTQDAQANPLGSTLQNLETYFDRELNQYICNIPDISKIARRPERHLDDLNLMLKLLLGCAFQCETRGKYISDVQRLLSPEDQGEIMIYIKGFLESCLDPPVIYKKIVKNIAGRKEFTPSNAHLHDEELMINLDEARTQSNYLKKKLDENEDKICRYAAEIDHNNSVIDKLVFENQELKIKAQKVENYRDELDVALKKAEQVDILENRLVRYEEMSMKMEDYKYQLDRLQKEYETLKRTKELLEEKSRDASRLTERAVELESKNAKLCRSIEEHKSKSMREQEKIEELRNRLFELKKTTVNKATVMKYALPMPAASASAKNPPPHWQGDLIKSLNTKLEENTATMRHLRDMYEPLRQKIAEYEQKDKVGKSVETSSVEKVKEFTKKFKESQKKYHGERKKQEEMARTGKFGPQVYKNIEWLDKKYMTELLSLVVLFEEYPGFGTTNARDFRTHKLKIIQRMLNKKVG